MTATEFNRVIVYLELATGRALVVEAREVYLDLLGDLDYQVFLTAAKRVALEHPWATFPSAAELRAAATVTAAGQIAALSPGEAWAIAWDVARNTDPEIEGSFLRAAKNAPPLVLEAIQAFGLLTLCYGDEPISVMRGQFIKVYEQLAARDRRKALYPPAVKKAIEFNKNLPPAIGDVLNNLHQLPPGANQ